MLRSQSPLDLPKETDNLPSIHFLRGIAALVVCVMHLNGEAHKMLPQPLNVKTWISGVDIFFVISGFIMIYTNDKGFGSLESSITFMFRRLIRIVPMYWLFTSLMVASIILFPRLLHTAQFSYCHLVLSLLFIPHISPDTSHDIHPILSLGWTLNYEVLLSRL